MNSDTANVLEIIEAFKSGTIFDAEDKKLNDYLGFIIDADRNMLHASGGHFDRAVIAPLISTILSIRQQRMVDAIERSNAKTQALVLRLTWLAVGLAAIQAIAAVIALLK